MATICAGEPVSLLSHIVRSLRFPPEAAAFYVVVHPGALKAGNASLHTQVVVRHGGEVVWVGALGEDLLQPRAGEPLPAVRAELSARLLRGTRLWEIVRPGSLLNPGITGPLSTIYHGERPWVIIGETVAGQPIATPLNDATNPKWYAPVVPMVDLSFAGSTKDSQVELAHAWTLRGGLSAHGQIIGESRGVLAEKVRAYYA